MNNAVWCDTICRCHGRPGEFRDGIWLNHHQTPPFYPKAVTLGGAGQMAAHQECIEELLQEAGKTGWGIKDSFRTLELDSLGFRVLFEAQWLYKPAAPATTDDNASGVNWQRVTTPSHLDEWEEAWRGEWDGGRIFLPSLLRNEDVAILAAWKEGCIIAGGIANRAAECVGISNVFVPEEQSQQLRHECVSAAELTFPNLPLVGYESGSNLEKMQMAGFETIGGLSVWLCPNETQ